MSILCGQFRILQKKLMIWFWFKFCISSLDFSVLLFTTTFFKLSLSQLLGVVQSQWNPWVIFFLSPNVKIQKDISIFFQIGSVNFGCYHQSFKDSVNHQSSPKMLEESYVYRGILINWENASSKARKLDGPKADNFNAAQDSYNKASLPLKMSGSVDLSIPMYSAKRGP